MEGAGWARAPKGQLLRHPEVQSGPLGLGPGKLLQVAVAPQPRYLFLASSGKIPVCISSSGCSSDPLPAGGLRSPLQESWAATQMLEIGLDSFWDILTPAVSVIQGLLGSLRHLIHSCAAWSSWMEFRG